MKIFKNDTVGREKKRYSEQRELFRADTTTRFKLKKKTTKEEDSRSQSGGKRGFCQDKTRDLK